MNYPFGKETSSYRQSETITPYQKEGQILDTKIGRYLKISSFLAFNFFNFYKYFRNFKFIINFFI